MKGPFESRHTSSERRAPGLSSHPGARRERVGAEVHRSTPTGSGRLTSAMHLSEHASCVLTLRLAHGRGHSELDGYAVQPPCGKPTHRPWRGRHTPPSGRGHLATTSLHSTRASATRALIAPFRIAHRRAPRPV